MIDVNKIGRKISQLRKEHNLTQAALAEKLFVSSQAVSSWERGLTAPDIDKLKDLTTIFDCTIEDIIGEDGKTAESAVKGETPRLEDLSRIAQIIEPQKLETLVKNAIERIKDVKMPVGTITEFAPYISGDLLGEMLDKADGVKVDDTVMLLPFLDADKLNDIADKAAVDEPQKILPIAPFLKTEKLDMLAEKIAKTSPEQLIVLAPFLSSGKLDELVSKNAVTEHIAALLKPFLGEGAK